MKILHLITTIERGGAENQLLILVREQIQLGNNITVAFLKGPPDLLLTFESLGIRVYNFKGGSVFSQVSQLKQLLSQGFSILHTHLPQAECIGWLANPSIPWVSTRHNSESFAPRLPKLISKTLSRVITRRTALVIAISEVVRHFLIDNKEISSKTDIHTIHYGYSPIKSPTQIRGKKRRNTKSPLRLVTFSRLVPQKDLETLVRACALLSQIGFPYTLEIYGAGAQYDLLQNQILQSDLEDKVKLCGKTDRVNEILIESDCLVLTSKYEGFGLVLLEAMVASTVIVACRNKAVTEVLGPDYIGLANISDYLDVAAKIIMLSDSKYRNQAISQLSHRISNFAPIDMAKKIQDEYLALDRDEVLNAH